MNTDVPAAQRVVADLLLDAGARRQWEADPAGFASSRLRDARAIAMIAGLDPVGIAAAAASVADKHERWSHFHDLGHARMDRIRAAEGAGPGHHDHSRDHGHDHSHGHDHGHVHGHGHDHPRHEETTR